MFKVDQVTVAPHLPAQSTKWQLRFTETMQSTFLSLDLIPFHKKNATEKKLLISIVSIHVIIIIIILF